MQAKISLDPITARCSFLAATTAERETAADVEESSLQSTSSSQSRLIISLVMIMPRIK
jgi:hypothetical protein